MLGCGSIGTRRAKLLGEMGHSVVGVDPKWTIRAAEDWRKSVKATEAYETEAYDTDELLMVDDVSGPFDVALICTPPDSGRARQIVECLMLGVRGVFVEKPLALTSKEVAGIVTVFAQLGKGTSDLEGARQNVVSMGACNLRFVPGLRGKGGLADVPGSPKYGRFTMGMAEKYWSATHTPISMALDSIHELDLARYLLGPIESVRGRSDKKAALLSVHHTGGNWSEIALDRRHDPPVRIATVESPKDMRGIRVATGDGMYRREMSYFLSKVAAGQPTTNPIAQAAQTCLAALEVVGT